MKSALLPHTVALNETVLNLSLAFDAMQSPDYRVICVWKSSSVDASTCQIETYSSETGCWISSRAVPFDPPIHTDFQRGVYWNGAIHWISPGETSLYFDVERDCVQTMGMHPISISSTERLKYFGVSDGHLLLIVNQFDAIDVHEMPRDYSGWILKYHVVLDDVGSAHPEIVIPDDFYSRYYEYSILGVLRGENQEDELSLVLSIPGKLISYNPSDRTSKVLCGLRNDEICYTWKDAFQYIKTLSCV